MKRRWGLFGLGWAIILGGALLAHLVQTSGGVRVEDVRYPGDGGTTLAALLYIPPTATAARPGPAVLVSHGYINTREMQSPFAIELARRGFVVLAIDMAGHGYSGGAVGADDGGGPASLRYLQNLPFVDKGNIGLEGHSMGGLPVVGAALAQPDGYRSMVLEGSTTPEPGQRGAGTPTFPRNVELVFGRYDEFAPLMWHVARGSQIGGAAKLQALFGTSGPVTANHLHGDIGRGDGRLWVDPPVIHPMEHFSAAGVGAAVDWFQKTLRGAASAKPPGDQIWLWKEVGTLASLAGFVTLLLGSFRALLATPLFADLDHPATPVRERRDARWWLAFAAVAAIPAPTFYPFMTLGFAFLPSPVFPQWVTNQLVVWALLNGAISVALGLVLRPPRPRLTRRWFKSLAVAILTVASGYLALVVIDLVFKVDFRFWVVGLKPLDARHGLYVLAYVVPFGVALTASLRSLNLNLAIKGESLAAQCAWAALAMALGFAALLAAQYVTLLATGVLITPAEALNTVIALQFVPVLAVVGLISAFTYRTTNDYLPGALICALLVTWYIVAGTATHWSPGWHIPKMAGLYPDRPAGMAPRS